MRNKNKIEMLLSKLSEYIGKKGEYYVYVSYNTKTLRLSTLKEKDIEKFKKIEQNGFYILDKSFKNGFYIGPFKSFKEALGALYLIKKHFEKESLDTWGVIY